MDKKFWLPMVLAMVALFIVACGDDDDDNTDNNTDPVTLTGAMQKGPLLKGSSLTVSMLEVDGGAPTGDTYATTTEDDLGAFNVVASVSGPCELIGDGFYYNEITDNLSGAPITLRALYEIIGGDPQEAYLNVFTHMSSGLALKYYREGTYATVAESVAAAEDILFNQLGILHPSGALEGHGTEMDLTGVDSPDNQYIMATSCIVGKAAELRASNSDEVDARLQELLNDVRSQLQNSGTIAPEYLQYIKDGEAALDPIADCVANLENYLYNKTGETHDLPDPNTSADMDDDGIPNATDPDIDGDGFDNADDYAPYDVRVAGASASEGLYIPGDGLMWQITPPTGYFMWTDAQSYCDGITYAGLDDWRMPTISELRSLVDGCSATGTDGSCGVVDECTADSCSNSTCAGCSTNEGPDSGCYWPAALAGECSTYWSSLIVDADDSRIWSVSFQTAQVDIVMGNSEMLARCVRDL